MDSFPFTAGRRPGYGSRDFDMATVIGAACAFGLVFLAILLGGKLRAFFDLNGALIVVGGTAGATLVAFPLADFKRAGAVVRTAFLEAPLDPEVRIRKITDLANRARTEGILALEPLTYQESDPFFRKCIQLVVDQIPEDDIRRTLQLELTYLEDRHKRGAQLFQTMGAVAPAMGLVGTLIGLVEMLQNLNDPSQIGPGMATALLGTFYGAMLAYLIFIPLAGKLRMRSKEEARLKELTMEGMLSIAKETNPRILEQRLLSFLPPEERYSQYD